jgi:hypothetical protein
LLLSRRIRELGRARGRMEGDDVAKDLREAALKAIDEVGSRIIALEVEAMLQRAEERRVTLWSRRVLRI